MASAWRNFKNIFSRPLFTIIFRPEMLKFHPYSILTGETMVVFVTYCVLRILINPSYHFNGDVDVVDFVAQMHIVEYAFVSFIIT